MCYCGIKKTKNKKTRSCQGLRLTGWNEKSPEAQVIHTVYSSLKASTAVPLCGLDSST